MAKKTILTCTLLLGLSPLLTSCVTSQDHRNLQLKVRNQNNRLVEMERQVTELQSGGGESVKTMQRQQADLATNMDRLKIQLLQIQGQVEEATHRNRALLDENQTFQQVLDAKIVTLAEQDKETQQLLQSTSDQVSSITTLMEREAQRKQEEAAQKAILAKQKALEAKLAQQKAQETLKASQNSSGLIELTPRMTKNKGKTTQQITKQTSVSSKETATGGNTSAEKLYDKGLGQYRAKKYKTCINSFEQFIEQNKSHKLLPNAKYWLGASRLKDGDYSGAVLEFQHIVADFPKHPKAPEALLKQAEAFGHFGDKMVQKKLYKDVIDYYPKSEQAKTAKAKLKKL